MNDDSLDQVINVKSSTGRATTPQLKRHNITPQRNGSAGRSRSTPKTQSSHQAAALAAATTIGSSRKRSHLSKRTRQRWENDHLFGLQIFLSKLQINDIENSSNQKDEEWNEGMIEINWTSLFHEILLPENSDALKAYLACASSFTQDPSSSSSHQNNMKTFQDCVTEWERAEYSWKNVEKRLRKVIQTAIVNQIEARNFILMIEDILLEMDSYLDRLQQEEDQEEGGGGGGGEKNQQIPFVYSIPHDMEHHFARPIRVKHSNSSKQQKQSQQQQQQQLPVLQITLRDSAYHRLLLHATCQFHGRNSKVPSSFSPSPPPCLSSHVR
jgi:hypothetical protein